MTFSISFNLELPFKAAFPFGIWMENKTPACKWMLSKGGAVCHRDSL